MLAGTVSSVMRNQQEQKSGNRKGIAGKCEKYFVQNQYLILTNFGMRKLLFLHFYHPIKTDHKGFTNFVYIFIIKLFERSFPHSFLVQFPLLCSPVPLYFKLKSMILTETKMKAGLNEHDCNKLANSGRAEFLLLLKADLRSSLLSAAPCSPPPLLL